MEKLRVLLLSAHRLKSSVSSKVSANIGVVYEVQQRRKESGCTGCTDITTTHDFSSTSSLSLPSARSVQHDRPSDIYAHAVIAVIAIRALLLLPYTGELQAQQQCPRRYWKNPIQLQSALSARQSCNSRLKGARRPFGPSPTVRAFAGWRRTYSCRPSMIGYWSLSLRKGKWVVWWVYSRQQRSQLVILVIFVDHIAH